MAEPDEQAAAIEPFQEGEVILLDDRVTGFDDNKEDRPYCVARVVGDPLEFVLVVPRTTEGTIGTLTEAGVLPQLNKRGRFLYRPYQVFPADLKTVKRIGVLPPTIAKKVLENVNFAAFDLEIGW
jgi:hypothetical protein